MAFNRCNKPVKPPTHALIYPFKTSKKRSYSISTPSAPAAKKVRPRAAPQPPIHVSLPSCPKASPFTPSLSPPASAQPLTDIDVEDNNDREKEAKDNNIEEPPSLLAVVYFISV